MQNFQALGAPPPDPRASSGWGLCPQTPKTAPQFRISSYAPATLCHVYNYTGVGSFCFKQFFLHRSVANLMMLTVDVRLIVFWLKNFICITQCVTFIPFCYIAPSYFFAEV